MRICLELGTGGLRLGAAACVALAVCGPVAPAQAQDGGDAPSAIEQDEARQRPERAARERAWQQLMVTMEAWRGASMQRVQQREPTRRLPKGDYWRRDELDRLFPKPF